MGIKRLISLFAAATLALGAVVLPAAPVMAIGTISISPTTGPVGSSVTVTANGLGAVPTQGYVKIGDATYGPYAISGQALQATVQVPKVARTASALSVYIVDPGQVALSESTYYTITPQIGIGATSASTGDSVSVYGNGFFASYTVAIYFDNAVVGTVNTDANGAFEGASFIVPPAYHGTHTVKARDTKDSPTLNISIGSRLIASPSSGAANDKTLLTGNGFAVNSPMTFYWDDTVVSGVSATTDLNGGFTVPAFTIPVGAKGSHAIKAQDNNANTATATFGIAQSIKVSPASGVSGTPITVTGAGFDSGKTITLKYGANTVAPVTGAISTDSSGAFSATFPVPAGVTGNFTIEAYDGVNLAQTTFLQQSDIKIGIETTAAKPGYIGQSVTVSGDGLRPNVSVSIYFASDSVLIANATTDGTGHFSTTIRIPQGATPGLHSITVTDSLTIRSFSFYVEDKAPSVPKPVTPKDADKVDEPATFTWDPVTDPSGVTYTLQVSIDKNFGALVIEKKNLAQATYTLSDQEKLPSNNSNNPYYWRVRATDGTGLDSGWSTAQAFNIGFVLELSAWMYGLLIGVGGILLFLMGFLLGRRVALR